MNEYMQYLAELIPENLAMAVSEGLRICAKIGRK